MTENTPAPAPKRKEARQDARPWVQMNTRQKAPKTSVKGRLKQQRGRL